MDPILITLRLVLAAVFAAAGLAKLLDPAGTRRAFVDFGLPAGVTPALAVLVPFGELAVALALLAAATAWWGSVAALALLAAFTAAIARNLARGQRPDCHCFGQLHAKPIGAPTLVRNVVLAAGAAIVVVQGPERSGPSTVAWLAHLEAGDVALALGGLLLVGLLAQTWFVVHLFHQQGRLLTRLDDLETRLTGAAPAEEHGGHHGLPVGAPAPAFERRDFNGSTVSLADLCAERSVLVLFLDPHCQPCASLLPDVARWSTDHEAALRIAILSAGSEAENRKKFGRDAVAPLVLLDERREVALRYSSPGTPRAIVVRRDGRIGSRVAAGADAIKLLVEHTVASTQREAARGGGRGEVRAVTGGLPVGAPVPPIRLPDLAGGTVDLADLRGKETLILFWNPGCGYCQQLRPELQQIETAGEPGVPALLVVSTGSASENRAQGFASPVLLDDEFAAGRAFGVHGTPSAVLVDAEGNVASEVAVGGSAVLALAAPLDLAHAAHS